MPYLLDANIFISASRLHYGFDPIWPRLKRA